ncbi:MAG: polysaccharide deacetylase family protein [Candidatus Omnitrophica bacterium]|nr:polysaccharide deacetylase family protein [Candidatus Omnitrophota bacterium]MDD5672184.1 polysaccharide deacetylase family protein [Candidatus Omnitrophota bacterium]
MIDGGMKLLGVTGRGVRILCYHRVNYHEKRYTTVSVDNFRDQMRYLAEHGYRTVSLSYLVDQAKEKRQQQDLRTGNGARGAGNVTRRVGETATRGEEKRVIASEAKQSQSEIATSPAGTRDDGHASPVSRDTCPVIPPQDDQKHIIITFDDGYRDNYVNAFPIMKEFGLKGCVFCVSDEIGKGSFLRVEEIHAMADAGFEFGSHTMSHPELVHLDEKSKWLEISESKKRLEEMLGIPIPYFCYPKGFWDEEGVDMVATAGYAAACSNRPGSNDWRHLLRRNSNDIYLLRRTEISGFDDLGDFRRKLNGAYDLLHSILHFVRGRP